VFCSFLDYTESIETSTAFPRTTFAADDNKLHIILPLVFVGLVILACVVVFVLWRRRQIAITQNAPITMRDRLRAESLNNLDARLLELSSANKPKQYRLDQVQYVKDLGEGFFGRVFQGTAMYNESLPVHFQSQPVECKLTILAKKKKKILQRNETGSFLFSS